MGSSVSLINKKKYVLQDSNITMYLLYNSNKIGATSG
jgi:hypothetical protein